MSYFLPRLESGWHVDQAILAEESRVVVIRFGHDWDSDCMRHDETLLRTAEKVKNMAVICASLLAPRCAACASEPSLTRAPPLSPPRADTVDITQVPDFNKVHPRAFALVGER